MGIERVGVVGLGTMGAGIAAVSAMRGYPTIGVEADPKALEAGKGRVDGHIAGAEKRQKISPAEAGAARGRFRGAGDVADLAGCDLVIEAVPEFLPLKRDVFRRLDAAAAPGAILASNTSCLSIDALAAETRRPGSVLGLHFFNPVPAMNLVEIVVGSRTSEATLAAGRDFAARLGKETVLSKDRPGFLVNRALMPYLIEAVRCLEEETGTAEDIDKAMRLGCGMPMGPFELMDLVGLDVCLGVVEAMRSATGDPKFDPPALLRRMVAEGRLGRKSGKGFRVG